MERQQLVGARLRDLGGIYPLCVCAGGGGYPVVGWTQFHDCWRVGGPCDRGLELAGLVGSNVVIQASRDLRTWISLQTNLLDKGPLYFSDPESRTITKRYYRAAFSP